MRLLSLRQKMSTIQTILCHITLVACILTPQAHAQTFPGDDAERLNMTIEGYLQLSDNPVTNLNNRPPYTDIFVAGNYAYIGSFDAEVSVIDISNPREMRLVTTFATPGPALDLKVAGDVLALGLQGEGHMGLTLVDISNPEEPEILSTIFEDGWGGVHNLYLYRNRAYLAHAASDGVTIVDISDPTNPTITGHWDNELDGFSNVAHDIFISDGMAYVSDIVSGSGGLVILDLQDPDNPVTVSAMPIPEGIHNAWQQGDYVYFSQEFGSWQYPLHVANISDPTNPIDVGIFRPNRVPLGPVTGPHNIWIEGDLLYWAYFDAGVRVFDISVPDHPIEIGYHTAVATWGTQSHSDGLIYAIDNWRGGISAMRFHKPSHAIRKVELGQATGVQGQTGVVGVSAWTAPLPGEADGEIDRVSVRALGVDMVGNSLVDDGEGRYVGRLPIAADMPSGRYQIQVLLEDDQGQSYPFNVPFALFPSQNLTLLSNDPGRSWMLESPNELTWTTFDGRQALVLAPDANINFTLRPPQPKDLFGYAVFRLVYHPGEVADKVTNSLRLSFNSSPFTLYNSRKEQPAVDMGRSEWQTIDIPLIASDTFVLPDILETLKIQGRLDGTSYLASIELVAGSPLLDTAVREEYTDAQPADFSIAQNYPNPFNSATIIRFDLDGASAVELAVYNLAGQKVAILVGGERQAGTYAINWDGRDARGLDLASGIYFYRLEAEGREQTRKMMLLR